MYRWLIFLWALFLLLPMAALATHDVYLDVPLYCQETNNWCGAASAQMTHDGYPTPPGPKYFSQTSLWNCIQAHKDDPSVNWATDPDGLKYCMNDMGHPPSGVWVVEAKSSYLSEMYAVLYWMTVQRYPTPVLVWHQQHWVVITGFTTDVDPTTHSTVSLQFIEFNNPWPPCSGGSGGTYHYVTGASWQVSYFCGPVNISSSKWYGKYIAVLEPPKKSGSVRTVEMVERGQPIPPEKAVKLALDWIKRYKLYKHGPLSVLTRTKPFEPLLVNKERKGYYIVPFGYSEKRIVAGIILNAYTGEFEDAGAFRKPIRYLTAKEAMEIVAKYTGLRRVPEPELIFTPCQQTEDYFWPLWKFVIKGEMTLYVDQNGKVYKRLVIPPPGD